MHKGSGLLSMINAATMNRVWIKDETGISIGLKGPPRGTSRVLLMRSHPGLKHCFTKGSVGQQLTIEGFRKEASNAIFHRPACSKHHTHSHSDQFRGEAGGQAIERNRF